jgi:hypothetical protein
LTTELLIKLLAIYLLVGACISYVGGAWAPLSKTRTYGVRRVQIIFLILGWLPMIMAQMVLHRTGKVEDTK